METNEKATNKEIQTRMGVRVFYLVEFPCCSVTLLRVVCCLFGRYVEPMLLSRQSRIS